MVDHNLLSSALYISPVAILTAFLLDIIFGEFKKIPHPVILIGQAIKFAELMLNRNSFSRNAKRAAGIAIAVFIPILAFVVTALMIKTAYHFGQSSGTLVTIFIAYTTLSLKGLKDAAYKVRGALLRDDVMDGRQALSHLVGRDTANLDTSEIVRGTVESVAENTSDGIIAPLFFLIIGGAPLAMAYKTVNTLDSMVGYKNQRYIDFGWASARLDDLLNYIPARLTGFLMIAASLFTNMDWRGALKVMRRDSKQHASPNAGYPEAATAGALNIRLGGESNYFGRKEIRPYMGDDIKKLEVDDIHSAVRIMYISSILMLIISVQFRNFFL